MEWVIPEKIQTGGVEDILFWDLSLYPQKIPEKKSFYPWKFCKFVWHPLEIPKSKTKTHGNSALVFLEHPWNFHMFFLQDPWKFHVLNLSPPFPFPVWIFSGIAQSPLLLCKVHKSRRKKYEGVIKLKLNRQRL